MTKIIQHLIFFRFFKRIKKDDSDAIAYSKVTVAYFVFGWCDEWYKRGMKNTPEEMARLFEQGKKQ